MPRLKSANFAVTELASGITNAATSFQVVDASLFPNEGPFIVLVHDSTPGFAGVREIMEVGSINKGTNTFSDVLRGMEGTFPVAHSAGARVECVWTAGTHEELADKADLDAHSSEAAPHSGHETPAGAQAKADGAEAAAKQYTDQEVGEVAQALTTHLAEHLRIEIGVAPPENPNSKTFWYEDLGESIDFVLGGGLLIGNASTDGSDDVWFDENI